MATGTIGTKAEAEIRAAIDRWADALRALDLDGIMANAAPDIVSFDCHSLFQMRGADALRGFLEACFPHMKGPMVFEIYDLEITAEDKIAFCHYIAHCIATGGDGQQHESWLRTTACLEKHNGQWLMVHGHCSAPFDAMTEKAMLDGKPAPYAA